MEPLNEAVEKEVWEFFTNLGCIPAEQLVVNACDRKAEVLQVAYRQAVSDFEKTQKQVNAMETEAVKALTGESQLDLSVVNGMLLKLRAQLTKTAPRLKRRESVWKLMKRTGKPQWHRSASCSPGLRNTTRPATKPST